jgi:hypothetical protein
LIIWYFFSNGNINKMTTHFHKKWRTT